MVRDLLARDRPVPLSAAVVASWARYAEGTDEQGRPIEVIDGRRDRLMAAARRQAAAPTAFIQDGELFGDLADHDAFSSQYVRALGLLRRNGARATLEYLLA